MFDNHRHPYFKSVATRRQLQINGFINDKGYIMYDTLYRDILSNINKLKENITQKKLLKYIQKLNIGKDIKNKETNVYNNTNKINVSTKRSLLNYKGEDIRIILLSMEIHRKIIRIIRKKTRWIM